MTKALENTTYSKTGVYIAYPTSPVLKSIYKPKNYKTMVNDQHTKVGKARDSFQARKNGYLINFDNEVVFKPLAIIQLDELERAENMILSALRSEFHRVGRAREWFDTCDHQRVIEIVANTLALSGIEHQLCWRDE